MNETLSFHSDAGTTSNAMKKVWLIKDFGALTDEQKVQYTVFLQTQRTLQSLRSILCRLQEIQNGVSQGQQENDWIRNVYLAAFVVNYARSFSSTTFTNAVKATELPEPLHQAHIALLELGRKNIDYYGWHHPPQNVLNAKRQGLLEIEFWDGCLNTSTSDQKAAKSELGLWVEILQDFENRCRYAQAIH